MSVAASNVEPIAIAYGEFTEAAALVHGAFGPTPLIAWPLLGERTGARVHVKHENHTPIGAFKIRGGIVLIDWLQRNHAAVRGVVTATRGNHGQSIAFAARRAGLTATIVVPHGNSVEKNAAMRALGAELIVAGHDFQAAREHAEALAHERRLFMIGPFHRELVRGVGTYAIELFEAGIGFDTVYVPIGQGSGICGLVNARDALRLTTKIVGVVAERAPAYARSFERRAVVSTESADTFIDGVACRIPEAAAVATIVRGVDRVVEVSEADAVAAMRAYFSDTHNVAEPAGAIPLAALLRERERMQGRTVGLVLTGGNVDRDVFARVLGEN